MQQSARTFTNWSEQLSVKLWQRSPLLATIWADGNILSYRPLLLMVAMAVVFTLGFTEGAFHWSFATIGDGRLTDAPAFTFVQMLPFVLLIAAIGAFDMRLGLTLLAGYVVGEQLIAGTSFVNPRGLNGFFWNLVHIRTAQLITYILFWMLVMMPRLTSRMIVASIRPLDNMPRLGHLVGLLPLVGLVTAWAMAAPMLMRPLWLWSFDTSSSIIVPYYMSVVMPWLAVAAAVGALARMALEEIASRDVRYVTRMLALEAHYPTEPAPTTKRRLPLWLKLALPPAFITLMAMGLITPLWPTAFVMFGSLYALNALNSLILPKLPRWVWLMEQMQRIPLLLRIVGLLVANYALAWLVISAPQASLRFHHDAGDFGVQLITLVLGFALALLFLPEAAHKRAQATPQPPSTAILSTLAALITLTFTLWPSFAMAECVEPRCCFVYDYWAVAVTFAVFLFIFIMMVLAFPELLFLLRGSATVVRLGARLARLTKWRPQGMPRSWHSTASNKNGGIKFTDPKNPHNSVRIMPPNRNSAYPNSREVYVRWTKNGRDLDVTGTPSTDPTATHIPWKDFRFIKEVFE